PARCCPGEERTLASGADLSLLVGTGFGPVILSRSAWTRIAARLDSPPAMTSEPLVVATFPEPIAAQRTTLPRLALMDRETDPALDPGPCVELGRARRLEQVALSQSQSAQHALCALPCDQDPRTDHRAQNSAGYLELAGDLPVAVIDDGEALLQTVRAEVHPGAPEIDGIIGADALRSARVELDYKSQPARAIFSCEAAAAATACRGGLAGEDRARGLALVVQLDAGAAEGVGADDPVDLGGARVDLGPHRLQERLAVVDHR